LGGVVTNEKGQRSLGLSRDIKKTVEWVMAPEKKKDDASNRERQAHETNHSGFLEGNLRPARRDPQGRERSEFEEEDRGKMMRRPSSTRDGRKSLP